MIIPRYSKSFSIEDNIRMIKNLMNTLRREYEKQLSTNFKESPVKLLDLAKIDEEIEKTDNKIDKLVYELYGLTEEEIQFLEVNLSR